MLRWIRNVLRLIERTCSWLDDVRERMVRPIAKYVRPNFLSGLKAALALAILVMLSVMTLKHLPFKGMIIACFIIAVVSDIFDGPIARITGAVTPEGALLDRLGDKLLVCAIVGALLWGHNRGLVVLVISSEFISISFAILGIKIGAPTDSEWLGKWKMVSQAVGIFILFFLPQKVSWAIRAFICSLVLGLASFWQQLKRAYVWLRSKDGVE